jgi:hypothetical protein
VTPTSLKPPALDASSRTETFAQFPSFVTYSVSPDGESTIVRLEALVAEVASASAGAASGTRKEVPTTRETATRTRLVRSMNVSLVTKDSAIWFVSSPMVDRTNCPHRIGERKTA